LIASGEQSRMAPDRTLPWDWHPGRIPDNVQMDPTAYVETTFSFQQYRSRSAVGVSIGAGASTYLGTMFDVGPTGRVTLGRYALVHGARIICDAMVEIGDYALISWNVVLMDSYRLPADPVRRRAALRRVPLHERRWVESEEPAEAIARPVRIGRNVWIGFDACVLPGVTIGEGAIVGAKSVVNQDVPPFAVAAGNPAVVLRLLDPGDPARYEEAMRP
jgi:acetyltransferase-like isoleucine patch superfamily enzyme